jgi:hypothetical protein
MVSHVRVLGTCELEEVTEVVVLDRDDVEGAEELEVSVGDAEEETIEVAVVDAGDVLEELETVDEIEDVRSESAANAPSKIITMMTTTIATDAFRLIAT